LINNAVVATILLVAPFILAILSYKHLTNDNTFRCLYDASPINTYDALWDNVITSSASGNIVTNTNTNKSFCTIQAANDVGNVEWTLEVSSGTYTEK
jgi:hypothetical protein